MDYAELEARLVRTAIEKTAKVLEEDVAPKVKRVKLNRGHAADYGYATGTVVLDVDGERFTVTSELRAIGHENYVDVVVHVRKRAVFGLEHIADALGL